MDIVRNYIFENRNCWTFLFIHLRIFLRIEIVRHFCIFIFVKPKFSLWWLLEELLQESKLANILSAEQENIEGTQFQQIQ